MLSMESQLHNDKQRHHESVIKSDSSSGSLMDEFWAEFDRNSESDHHSVDDVLSQNELEVQDSHSYCHLDKGLDEGKRNKTLKVT